MIHVYEPRGPVYCDPEAATHLNIIRGSLSYEFGNSNPIVASTDH